MGNTVNWLANRADMVEPFQRKLKYLGFYSGPCDGRMNEQFGAAIEQFCRENDLKDDDPQVTCDRITALAGYTFAEVMRDELSALRGDNGRDADLRNASQDHDETTAAHRAAFAGLAFSGGGVRSATFNLGIIQALAEARLLRHFDYLSTVSGGGYIGGWLSKWIAQCKNDVTKVEDTLAQAANPAAPQCEPRQVTYLRQYCNYLTPRAGLFTLDTWAFMTTYLRNMLLNFLILGLALAAFLAVPRLWISIVADGTAHGWYVAVTALALLFVVHQIAFAVSLPRDRADPHGQRWILWRIVLPLMLAVVAGSAAFWWYREALACAWNPASSPACASQPAQLLPQAGFAPWRKVMILAAPGVLYFAAWVTGWRRAGPWEPGRAKPAGSGDEATTSLWRQGCAQLLCALGACAIGAGLLTWLATMLQDAHDAYVVHVSSFGPAVLLGIFGVTMTIMVGLAGRGYSDQSREWWSRLGAWTLICLWCWSAVIVFSVYSPMIMLWVQAHAPGWGGALLTSGWLGMAWSTLWAARKPESTGPEGSRRLKALVAIGPPVLVALVLAAVASMLHLAITRSGPMTDDRWSEILRVQSVVVFSTPMSQCLLAVVVCLAAAGLLANRVDVNKFSMYMMYRNRLVRTYLGAVDACKRSQHPFTGFDPKDDMPLNQVGGNASGIQRPYLIINTALNLTKGDELAWQTRKAANFTFTPRFCGFETPRMPVSGSADASADLVRGAFRPTRLYGRKSDDPDGADKGVKLGMAMAISGAAVASSMGYHSSHTLAFIATLFNVRLGRWCGNPAARDDSWKKSSPPLGIGYLLAELFGQSDARASYFYLSDGGHFENLGIYELVRRRCRLIVAIDASADQEWHFEDLGNAVRKCHTDFHVEIDINVNNIEPATHGHHSRAYYAVGKISYSKTDPKMPNGAPAPDGTLLYIKPCLLGSEYVGIADYHRSNPEFPHQSTADQWFDETQFESYRALGHHIGQTVFGTLRTSAGASPSVEDLCKAIERGIKGITPHAMRVPGVPIRLST